MIIQPPAVLLQGAPGAGKTDSGATLLQAGLEVFVICTEADGIASFLDSCARRRIPIDKLHWTNVLPAAAGFSALEDMINTIGSQSYEQITAIKSGVGKSETRKPAMAFLNALRSFNCERTGQNFGSYTDWDDTCALVVDSLSGISLMSMALTIGYKPAAHQGEWGVAMNFIEQLLLKISSDRKCFFVLTSHVEREMNEVAGSIQVMCSTLGKKLAPKIPRFFSEHVWAKRTLNQNNQAKFFWSTVDSTADLKSRSLAISPDLEPSFMPVVAAYKRRKELAGVTVATPAVAPGAIVPIKGPIPVAPLRPATS